MAGTKAPTAKQRANWARFARMARARAKQAKAAGDAAGKSASRRKKVAHKMSGKAGGKKGKARARGGGLPSADTMIMGAGALGTAAVLVGPTVGYIAGWKPKTLPAYGNAVLQGVQDATKPAALWKAAKPPLAAAAVVAGKRALTGLGRRAGRMARGA